ncbi:SCP2 domain-containing protein [Thiomonas sp. FB-6]|uniref:ubiquinone biosynthesis accessory factor UbiJ n=1 Tax=Thiomonas sp. FB-6 TaxID=1158291 RepID=UPI00036E9D0B|nr:hypothetical protein [Thiomonas sp. FB-6]
MAETSATAGPATGRAFADAQRQVLRALAAVLDHLLQQQPEGRRRLLPHAGKTLELRAGAISLRFGVSEDARLLPAAPEPAAEQGLAPPALRLDVDVARWLSAQLRGGAEAALGGVRIAGDAEFAQAVSWLLGHLRWDAEADMARVVGDVVAHRAARAAGAAAARARAFARRAETDAREWLREGPRAVVGRWELQSAAADVARLRDAAARLEKRVDALRRRLHGA